jgi:cytochrome c553
MNGRLVAGFGIAAGAALMALAGGTIEVDTRSYEGRTQAAIDEFRVAVALDPDLAHGKTLFVACAQCHQSTGVGSTDGTIPVIAGQHVSVVVKQLVDFRHDRRWHAKMQSAAKSHELSSPQDILDVAAYAESLQRPPPPKGGMGDDQSLKEGQIVYYRECAECHGRLAEGDLRTLRPRLAGQHYAYLLRQLNETASGQRPGMDDAHVKRIGALSEAERSAVADHLSRLSPGFSSTN